MAIGAIRAAAEVGLRVPEDLSIVGFDDIQLAPHVNPPLTTMRQDKLGLGAAAGDALIARVAGDTDRSPLQTLAVELDRPRLHRPARLGGLVPPDRHPVVSFRLVPKTFL